MREIKFRAWDENQKIMFKNVETGRITIGDFFKNIYSESKNCIFMQFTGLYDKNGKEIYEGDIFLFHDLSIHNTDEENNILKEIYGKKSYKRSHGIEHGDIFKIEWFCDGFYVKTKMGLVSLGKFAKNEIEVIGNIHENPELLKK